MMEEERINQNNSLNAGKKYAHRRTYSQNGLLVANKSRKTGYLFEHERRKSLKKSQRSKFQDLVQKIDEKLATNRAKRRSNSRCSIGNRASFRGYC